MFSVKVLTENMIELEKSNFVLVVNYFIRKYCMTQRAQIQILREGSNWPLPIVAFFHCNYKNLGTLHILQMVCCSFQHIDI